MQTIRKRWLPILITALVIGGPIAWYKWPSTASAAEAALTAPVKQGNFKVTVTTTGELRARKFVQIQGPNSQSAGVYQTKITWMVPEGTVVKEGEKIAELDRGPAATRLQQVMLDNQKAQAEYTNSSLDSTLNLSQAREDVRTAEYALEEKKIAKEQAQYEAPTIKRQAEIDYEKAQRALDQSKKNLDTKTKQAVAKMTVAGAEVGRQQNNLKMVQDAMAGFTITAPSPGMVIYVREWNGKKKGVGSQWSPWDPTVATLPDLTQMESQTYVNEVDVRKLGVGQPVVISLDADPTKKLSGKVTAVANVGEQRPNQDSKVFEVKIDVAQADTTLRPGMTTSNAIEIASVANVLSVPLDAVVSEGGYSYVYRMDGRSVVRQMVETGAMNDNEIVVKKGLTKDDRVLLTIPTDKTGIKTIAVPGLKPATTPTQGDTAKSVTLPAKPDAKPDAKADTKADAKGVPAVPAPAARKP
ncbi:MAG TPA: HlyD family efflux transporter periplasmic adaptor subunit [Gemmatimonadaceae bacterium]|jgi:RND family efflux transporter MFP subunit|nr:HlyD family efflux transporter periplasmic adaptor subunit [Gemmatimonadaceae bacterium]